MQDGDVDEELLTPAPATRVSPMEAVGSNAIGPLKHVPQRCMEQTPIPRGQAGSITPAESVHKIKRQVCETHDQYLGDLRSRNEDAGCRLGWGKPLLRAPEVYEKASLLVSNSHYTSGYCTAYIAASAKQW